MEEEDSLLCDAHFSAFPSSSSSLGKVGRRGRELAREAGENIRTTRIDFEEEAEERHGKGLRQTVFSPPPPPVVTDSEDPRSFNDPRMTCVSQ